MSIMTITEQYAFEHWEAGKPVHADHPDEERQVGDTLRVPLYDGDGIVNVLDVYSDGSASTFSAMVHPKSRREPTRGIAKTEGVVAVAGRAKGDNHAVSGAEFAGSESEYSGGRLAGAPHVYLTVGWGNARRIFESTGAPAVAALEDELLTGSSASAGTNLVRVAHDLRRALPSQTAITIAVHDDRTQETQRQQRNADIEARHAEEYAQQFDVQSAKTWKIEETRKAAEQTRMNAIAVTLFGAAEHAADVLQARLLKLGRASS